MKKDQKTNKSWKLLINCNGINVNMNIAIILQNRAIKLYSALLVYYKPYDYIKSLYLKVQSSLPMSTCAYCS